MKLNVAKVWIPKTFSFFQQQNTHIYTVKLYCLPINLQYCYTKLFFRTCEIIKTIASVDMHVQMRAHATKSKHCLLWYKLFSSYTAIKCFWNEPTVLTSYLKPGWCSMKRLSTVFHQWIKQFVINTRNIVLNTNKYKNLCF